MTLDSQLSEYFHETDAIRRGVKPEVKSFLDDCPADKVFWLVNGTQLKNLQELHNALREMEDPVFIHHANKAKNDFSDWIRDVIGDIRLAKDLKRVRTKKGMADRIAKRIKELR